MPSLKIPASILIVEGDILLAQHIALQLVGLGYSVAGILSKGEDVIAQIDLHKPDLMLMDIMLAGGMETARKIKLNSSIPVIFLTAHTDSELVAMELATGPFAYLQKPLKHRELELTLELALLRQRMKGQNRISRMMPDRRVAQSQQSLAAASLNLEGMTSEQPRNQFSLRRFNDALDASADSIFLIDRVSMRFIDVNSTACERSGYSKSELLEMGPQDIKPYFTRQMLEHKFDRIAATQDRFGIIDTFHQCKNKEIFPVEVRLRAMESDAQPTIVAIARDMTLRYQTEQALLQSEEQFRQITKNLQHALWLHDISSGKLIYASHAFEKIWGCTFEQVSKNPQTLLANVHPDDRERLTTAMQRMWGEKCDIDEEFRLLFSEGLLFGDDKIRWLRTRTFPIHDNDGKVYRIGGVTEDITVRKENEEKLRLSEEKFRLLFERSPIGLGLVSHDRHLVEVNPALGNMLGYNQAELIGKTLDEITHHDDLDISLENIDQLFNSSAPAQAREKRYLHKTGKPIWGRLNSTIVSGQDQMPLFALDMIENIDQIKQAENVRLAQEIAQKKALVREIHHRIKNHLQGVVGLMQQHLQNNSQCGSTIEAAIEQINVVATIHGLQGSEASGNVDLLHMLTAIRQALMSANPDCLSSPVKVAQYRSIFLNPEESVPIALALNELMVNAAKHGTGSMDIALNCNNEQAIIRIENRSCKTAEIIKPGSGLKLVQALLQTQGVKFRHEYLNQRFMAEIILNPPVIQLP